MKNDIRTDEGRYDTCSEIFFDIENELKAKLKVDDDDDYLFEVISVDVMWGGLKK